MCKKLEGKVAIVTGGARGIGKAICARLAAEGLTEEEFNMARDAMLFRLARAAESPHSTLEFTLLDMFYGETANAIAEIPERIKGYTLEEFNETIRASFTAPVTVTVHAGKLQ